jgi:hypothetical protein
MIEMELYHLNSLFSGRHSELGLALEFLDDIPCGVPCEFPGRKTGQAKPGENMAAM